jgi:hypothetical protein
MAAARAAGPIAGRYRAPDEKTIWVVLDRLDLRALARALPGPGPRSRQRPGPPAASVLCLPRTSSTSCDQAVFVDHATDASASPDVVSLKIDRFG